MTFCGALHTRARFLVVGAIGAACVVSCSDGGRRPQTPTAADSIARSSGMEAASAASDDPVDRSHPLPGRPGEPVNLSSDVTFPPRDQALAFRQELEATYRDTLRRTAATTFVDIEGGIVWTTEYLRYRVNGCGHADAVSRVQSQIQGSSAQPVCAAFAGTAVEFPPRNEAFAFRTELERLYRDVLRRSAVQLFVDAEGDIVWTQEYLRYRVNNCSQSEATGRVIDQVRGGTVQAACDGSTAAPGGVSDFVSAISVDDIPATLVSGGRPNAGAGPIITVGGNNTLLAGVNQISLSASQPVDTIVASVDDAETSSMTNGSMAVPDSYYVIRLREPRTVILVNLDLPGRAIGRRFSVQFAASVGGGPFGPYGSRPVTVQRCSYSVTPTSVTIPVQSTGAFDVMVNTMPMCRWTPSTPSFWMLAGPQGIGPGIARFGYLFASDPRTGVVRISFVAPPGEPSFIDIPVSQR